ncbi:hypothetical protein EJ05DRAFT_486559 [Pseudovirgaria hyperparasitica]|uniref:Ankyrin 2,3/unc44 n=1 Tax=Pseudovirgaria hyperparasitica TaxID=470096 RepID=A0A6A6W8U6_9PEZI|nr:uncharacterized protein EJ05DRAFT_486559 [Pseudovirgaria hyperparasitica]KAF2757511.1 hypothetical protein EJ05DRAFT_486559 [Pseudovirgaria hyperparasitica]
MACPERSSPKLFARDIAAYSDAELDRYLVEHGRIVSVEDPDNLPDEFIQRLRDRARRRSGTVESRPVDLDKVTALLQDQVRRSPSLPTTASQSPDPEEEYQEDLRRQTGYYNMLVDDGGRPSHPLSMLESIVENPREYREILSFWHTKKSNGGWRVFDVQVMRWRDFRALQRFARGQRGYDYWRSLWDEESANWAFHSPWMAEMGYSEKDWQNSWRLDQQRENYVQLSTSYMSWRLFVKCNGKKIGQCGFPEYAEALKERLARHGFERPFQLDKDATRQDKMTTWIEYLAFEYWWYDYYLGSVRTHQEQHDNAWTKLVDSEVLRPEETEESICDVENKCRNASEFGTAKRAMQSATLAVTSAETAMAEWQQSKLSKQTLQNRLSKARSRLETIQAEVASLQRRSDCLIEFIHRTRVYRTAKKDAEHHEVLLRWMLQQIPLIEAELNPPNAPVSDKRGGKNLRKRSRNRSEELDRISQQQSRGEGVSGRGSDRLAPADASFQEPPSKRSRRTANHADNALDIQPNEHNSSKRPRRIASLADKALDIQPSEHTSNNAPNIQPSEHNSSKRPRRIASLADKAPDIQPSEHTPSKRPRRITTLASNPAADPTPAKPKRQRNPRKKTNGQVSPPPSSSSQQQQQKQQQSSQSSQPLRRSARIAERERRLRDAAATSKATEPAQTPTAPPSKRSSAKKREAETEVAGPRLICM